MNVHKQQVITLADWKLSDYNPRSITREAMDGLKASIREFGMVQPIVVNEVTGNVVGGHQRYRALVEMERETAPAIVVSMDELQEKALNLTLNNLAIQGRFVDEKLDELLHQLDGLGYDMMEQLLMWEMETPASDDLDPQELRDAIEEADGFREPREHECPECGHRWEE
jgi:hypothetical protein